MNYAQVLWPLASPDNCSGEVQRELRKRSLLSGVAKHDKCLAKTDQPPMKYHVYILRSQKDPKQFYIGYTTDLENRMENHQNPKASAYTRQYAPWELETHVVFKDKGLAQKFEIYLKSHSGRAFLRKHLINGLA